MTMQSSSLPPPPSTTSQKVKNTYDDYVLEFGNLSINHNYRTDPASATDPPSVGGKTSEELIGRAKTQPEESPATTLFPSFQPSGEVNWTTDTWWPPQKTTNQRNIWAPPAYDAKPQSKIWAAPAYDATPQITFGAYTPGSSEIGRNQNINNAVDKGYFDYKNPTLPSAPAPAPAPPLSPFVHTQQQLGNLQDGFDIFQAAINPNLSNQLRRIIEEGKFVTEIMRAVLPSIIQLMSDENGHQIFEALLDRLDRQELPLFLYAIIKILSSDTDSFLRAAVVETGSRSVQKLIRKLKNTGLESYLTLFLSQFAFQIMTDKIASHIIRQCFLVFGEGPNEVLYDCALEYFPTLATDHVGCITINQCIDCITGSRRSQLLSLVAVSARQLSHDPSGNFVLQHVMDLSNDGINQYICNALKDQFVLLAQKKGGSHVVERCLNLRCGRSIVILEIFKNEKTILSLARDQFGNYVVQTALKIMFKIDRAIFDKVAEVLGPNHSKLVQKVKDHFAKSGNGDVLRCSTYDGLFDGSKKNKLM